MKEIKESHKRKASFALALGVFLSLTVPIEVMSLMTAMNEKNRLTLCELKEGDLNKEYQKYCDMLAKKYKTEG